jgi:hypothetical protein
MKTTIPHESCLQGENNLMRSNNFQQTNEKTFPFIGRTYNNSEQHRQDAFALTSAGLMPWCKSL